MLKTINSLRGLFLQKKTTHYKTNNPPVYLDAGGNVEVDTSCSVIIIRRDCNAYDLYRALRVLFDRYDMMIYEYPVKSVLMGPEGSELTKAEYSKLDDDLFRSRCRFYLESLGKWTIENENRLDPTYYGGKHVEWTWKRLMLAS